MGFESYQAPERLEDALRLLAENEGHVRPVAGGTDVMVRVNRRLLPVEERILMSLRRLPELAGIEYRKASREIRVGAAVSVRDLIESDTIRSHVPILASVGNAIASPQIRSAATVGGNLANASPAADLAIPLLLLDAQVETATWSAGSSDKGGDEVKAARTPVREFLVGPGQTTLDARSLITAFWIREPDPAWRFSFQKGGVRPAMECAVVSAGCGVALDEAGVVRDARVAFGAVAPTPVRALDIEGHLHGRRLDDECIRAAMELVEAAIQPISDVRGGAEHRVELTKGLLRVALQECARGGETGVGGA